MVRDLAAQGHPGLGLPQQAGDILRLAPELDQANDRRGLFQDRQRLAVDVLDQLHRQALLGGELANDHGDRRQTRQARRPPAPLAGHQEITPGGLGMQGDDQGLDDPLGRDRRGQGLQAQLVEAGAGLVRIGVDQGQVDLLGAGRRQVLHQLGQVCDALDAHGSFSRMAAQTARISWAARSALSPRILCHTGRPLSMASEIATRCPRVKGKSLSPRAARSSASIWPWVMERLLTMFASNPRFLSLGLKRARTIWMVFCRSVMPWIEYPFSAKGLTTASAAISAARSRRPRVGGRVDDAQGLGCHRQAAQVGGGPLDGPKVEALDVVDGNIGRDQGQALGNRLGDICQGARLGGEQLRGEQAGEGLGEGARAVRLAVQVHQQDGATLFERQPGQVNGDGRFTDAPLLVRNRECLHGYLSRSCRKGGKEHQ